MLNNVLCYIVYLIAHITTTQRVQQTFKALLIPFSSLKTKISFDKIEARWHLSFTLT